MFSTSRPSPILAAAVLVVLVSVLSWAQPFAPPIGKTILFVGQDIDSINAYLKEVGPEPAGFMSYTSLINLEGLTEAYDVGGGVQNAQPLVDAHPNVAWQLGLYMVGELESTASGHRDDNIDRLGKWIQSTNRPVYLRIGYEFDLRENNYDPKLYRAAYQHIVDRLRGNGVTNVAFVWHTFAQGHPERFDDWYPGDKYVDWVGASYFGQFPKFVNQVADLAERHHKPFMLAETSSWNVRSEAARPVFFKRLFKFVKDRHVSALCYIDTNWDTQEMWIAKRWGDGRVQPNPDVLSLWQAETGGDAYLKSSPGLFKTLGYAK